MGSERVADYCFGNLQYSAARIEVNFTEALQIVEPTIVESTFDDVIDTM